jgi:hypothetical protein
LQNWQGAFAVGGPRFLFRLLSFSPRAQERGVLFALYSDRQVVCPAHPESVTLNVKLASTQLARGKPPLEAPVTQPKFPTSPCGQVTYDFGTTTLLSQQVSYLSSESLKVKLASSVIGKGQTAVRGPG